jgi:hypothetical protein
MPHELEAGVAMKMFDIAFGTGEQIINAQYLVTLRQQAVYQVRP